VSTTELEARAGVVYIGLMIAYNDAPPHDKWPDERKWPPGTIYVDSTSLAREDVEVRGVGHHQCIFFSQRLTISSPSLLEISSKQLSQWMLLPDPSFALSQGKIKLIRDNGASCSNENGRLELLEAVWRHRQFLRHSLINSVARTIWCVKRWQSWRRVAF
jgi:hypothetical protein